MATIVASTINVHRKGVSSSPLAIDIDGSDTVTYASNVYNIFRKVRSLEKKGHKIEWSKNERFCIIEGKTYNIAKSVYEYRKNRSMALEKEAKLSVGHHKK